MKTVDNKSNGRDLNRRLASSGLRFTAQRQHIYEVLLARRDHPTAEGVFIRAKKRMPEISMATVYNCLEALVTCGLLKQVHLDGGATRYCSNMKIHGHFYCDACGSVFDFDLAANSPPAELRLPRGYTASHYDLAVHGTCSHCAGNGRPRARRPHPIPA